MSRGARIVGVLVLCCLLAVGGFVVYMLPSDDVPQDPDAVVVLGGAGQERAALGIELAERYDATLVFSSSARYFGSRFGVECGDDALCFEPVPENTAGEAENLARMAAEEGWEQVVVATSEFHTSRSRFLFRQCLGEERVSVVGATHPDRPSTTPQLLIRESLGIVAGTTFARAC